MMRRVDHPTAKAVAPTPPSVGTEGFFGPFVNSSSPATKVPYWWFNAVQESIRNVGVAAGVTAANWSDYDWLATAIQTLNAQLAPFPRWISNQLRFYPGGYVSDSGVSIRLTSVVNLAAPTGTSTWAYPVVWRKKSDNSTQITWHYTNSAPPFTLTPPSGVLSDWDAVVYKYPVRLNSGGNRINSIISGGTPRNPVISYVGINWGGFDDNSFNASGFVSGDTTAYNQTVSTIAGTNTLSLVNLVPPISQLVNFQLTGSDMYLKFYRPGNSSTPLRITGGDNYVNADSHFINFQALVDANREIVIERIAASLFINLDVAGFVVTEIL